MASTYSTGYPSSWTSGGSWNFNSTYPLMGQRFLTGNTVIGKKLSTATFWCKEIGASTGNVQAQLLNSSGSVLETSTNTIDTSTVGTSLAACTFNFSNTNEIANGDLIMLSRDTGNFNNDFALFTSEPTDQASNTGFNYSVSGAVNYDCALDLTLDAAPPSSSGTRLPPPPAFVRI